jgi:hypothetical protein
MATSETVYSSGYSPDPRRALDVLAFVLTPPQAFANVDDEEELLAVTELLDEAKHEAVKRWFALMTETESILH